MAEQIMQATADKAIPAGYKQTEVGIIPEDWVVYSVGDIIQRSQLGGNYENTENTSDYPLIKMGNLGRGYISLDKIEYVTSKPSSKDRLMFGDVLFNTRNTLELVGKVAVWRNELDEAYFNSNILRFYFDKNVVADSFFMNLAMNTSGFISQLSGIATGTTSVAAIYTRDLYTLKMAIPEKQEQTAIANVLSDSDALIDALEQLIAKKQAIKTATMQQLLTGRTRLPQFALRPDGTPKGYKTSELGQIPEDWITPTLKDITSNIIDYRGRTPRKLGLEWGGGNILALSAGNVKKGFIDYEAECYFGSDELYKKWMTSGDASKGDIVFTMEAPLGNVALIPNEDKYILSQRTILLQLERSKFLPTFIIQVFLSDMFQSYISESATGSTAQGIKRATFEKMFVAVPSCLEEQTAIATILSDMDSELTALEQKLAKARDMKQGMMQQLLTGRIRLPLEVGV